MGVIPAFFLGGSAVQAADNKSGALASTAKKKAMEAEAANVYKQINGKPKIFNHADIPEGMLSAMDEAIRHEAKLLGGDEYAPQREIGCGKLVGGFNCFVVTYLLEGDAAARQVITIFSIWRLIFIAKPSRCSSPAVRSVVAACVM